MTNPFDIAVASPALDVRQDLAAILLKQGFEAYCAATAKECCALLENSNIGLVFCDWNFPDGDYRNILVAANSRGASRNVKVVLISHVLKPPDYDDAKRSGAFAIVQYPCNPTNVEWMIILAKRERRSELIRATNRGQKVASSHTA